MKNLPRIYLNDCAPCIRERIWGTNGGESVGPINAGGKQFFVRKKRSERIRCEEAPAQSKRPLINYGLLNLATHNPLTDESGMVGSMFRWQWDPLRSHPRFQKILAAAEPKTVY